MDAFVNLGRFTIAQDKRAVCDHSTVTMFVPFTGKWMHVLAAFATRSNVKVSLLMNIMLEADILAEKAGLGRFPHLRSS